MKVTIFNGSPRKQGNTSEFTNAISKKLIEKGVKTEEIMLYTGDIRGCSHCGACQKKRLPSHCMIMDDMQSLYQMFLDSDLVILATPIYMWQFTPCTLAFMNRLHCLCESTDFSYNDMKGKKMAVILTMGDGKDVAEPSISGFTQFCEYYSIEYKGVVMAEFASKDKIVAGEYNKQIDEFVNSILLDV
ncbi:MAG: flavodoxin family protein [Candidatus Methanomethylophilaceae archaeon]|nr:flavodoxin family protein [Candidatus Methanomethylophilaceae archaeon]MDY0224910.1 flavodoxin family protein [Candidatus Methanomethylophilaceae archaeon]